MTVPRRFDLAGLPEASALGLAFHRKRTDVIEGVPLFSIMRDEKYFLPHFLSHYRALGVKAFFIYADRCDDAFMAMLEKEHDVSIITSSFAKFDDVIKRNASSTRLSYFVKELVSNVILAGMWHVLVDADEFLVLPPPAESLDAYARFLESQEMNHAFAPMVDFYPRRLRDRRHDRTLGPFAGSPYFDRGSYHRLDPETGKVRHIGDGVRERILAYLALNARKEIERAGLSPEAIRRPVNYKFPFMKSSGKVLRQGAHWITNVASIENASTIAHFKFYPDLDEKLRSALSEAQYHNNSAQYRFLRVALDVLHDADLVFEGSVRFSEPADLVRAGVMKEISADGRSL